MNWGHQDELQKVLGDYTKLAFTTAREANPKAVLLLNNSGNETPYLASYGRDLIIAEYLHQQGLLDGMGLQMHIMQFDTHIPTYGEILTTILRYKNVGIPVYITELDVNLQNITGSDGQLRWAGIAPASVNPSTNRRFLIQAKIYENIIKAALDSDNVMLISFFSTADRSNWYREAFGWEKADSTLFDNNLAPKPAYYVLMQLLYRECTR